MTDTFFYYRTP